MSEQCARLDCYGEASCEMTLARGGQSTTYHLCPLHYAECLVVIQGIKAVTNLPQYEGEQEQTA